MSACSQCGHDNESGRDFCAECGEFLGWNDEPAVPARPAKAEAIAPTRSVAVSADPAVLQAEEDARLAEEEAARVRTEAEMRARVASETAKRVATDEARSAREAAYGRAEQVVELATQTAGGSRAEVAALVAQVRREAESKAQSEVADAELRAARKARRAREEAHTRARAEAAEAERKAAEAAERAGAMIARTPARAVEDTEPTLTTPVAPTKATTKAPPDPAGHEPATPAVAPVRPAAPQWQPPPVTAPESAPVANPGDVICSRCGTGSEPSRRFCRKCGTSLVVIPVPPAVSWPRRVWTWLQMKLGRLRRRRGDQPETVAAPGSSGPGISMAGLARGTLAVAAVVGIFAAIGPYRQQARTEVTNLRRRVIPRPSYVEGEAATTGPQATPVRTLTDKTLDPAPFASTAVNTTNPPAPGSPPVFSVAVGKDGDLAKPVNLFKVGIITGVIGEQPPKHPSVHHLYVVARGKDGRQQKAKSLTLRDDTSFQSFLFMANHVARVDFYVIDTYTGADRQGPYTVDQVEFFALT